MRGAVGGRCLLVGIAAAGLLAGCGRPYVAALQPPPLREHIPAPYEATWRALLDALARENVPLRVVAKDSGVIASDDFPTPIGAYADCGRVGDTRLEGEALVTFTVFVQAAGANGTAVQVNAKMRTLAHRKGSSGKLTPNPVFQCASTGRWESNLLDAVRLLVRP
jgi:hypothetical protein